MGLVITVKHGESVQVGSTVITLLAEQRKGKRTTIHFDGPDKVRRITTTTNGSNDPTTKEK